MTLERASLLLSEYGMAPIAVEEKIHNSKSSVIPGASSYSLMLPIASGADYNFGLLVGEYNQFFATLLSAPNALFWYYPIEYPSDDTSIERTVRNALDQIALHETRIVQRRGLLFHSFTCDTLSDGQWDTVYGYSALKLTFKNAPPIEGREHLYRSPALIQSSHP